MSTILALICAPIHLQFPNSKTNQLLNPRQEQEPYFRLKTYNTRTVSTSFLSLSCTALRPTAAGFNLKPR